MAIPHNPKSTIELTVTKKLETKLPEPSSEIQQAPQKSDIDKQTKPLPQMRAPQLERFFKFLEVDINNEDQSLFIRNMLNSQTNPRHFRKTFDFTRVEKSEFIHNHYEAIWTSQQKPLPASHDLFGWFKLSQDYKKHIQAYNEGEKPAVKAVKKAMLTTRIAKDSTFAGLKHSQQEKKFFDKLQQHYRLQYKALNRLFNIVTEIEGDDFLTKGHQAKISKIDYKRWADELMQQELKAAGATENFYKINNNELAKSTLIEKKSLHTRIAFTAISVSLAAIALVSGDPSQIAGNLSTASQQTIEGCDTLTSLVNALLFTKNNQPGIALANLSIGVGRISSQALAISLLVAPALFSTTAAISISFITPTCSVAMAGLYHYRMYHTQAKLDLLEKALSDINAEIQQFTTENATSPQTNNEHFKALIDARSSLENQIETEKAAYLDFEKNQKLWLQIAAVTAAIALVTVLIASSASSFGFVPIIMGLAFAAYSIHKEYLIAKDNVKTDKQDRPTTSDSDTSLSKNEEATHENKKKDNDDNEEESLACKA